MITLSVNSNIKDVMRQMDNFQRTFVPIATVKALTFTAEKVREAERELMVRTLQNPTKYTLNSLRIKSASLRDPEAGVYFKDFASKGVPAGRYLYWQIFGGTRQTKSTERRLAPLMAGHRFIMPGGAAVLDLHGNMKGAVFTKVLSQLKALDKGQNQTPETRKKNKKKGGSQYFIPRPGSGLAPAVYKRFGRQVVPILHFTSKAHYRPRFPFYDFGTEFAKRVFPIKFSEQLDREMRRAFSTKLPSPS